MSELISKKYVKSDQVVIKVNDKLSCISDSVPPAPAENAKAYSNNYPPYFSELNFQLAIINSNLNKILNNIYRVEL